MPTILITGASRGLGLEFARQYAAAGWRVLATVRSQAGAGELAKAGNGIEAHVLDVTDHAGIDALAARLAGTPIDVLLCNAGVYGRRDSGPGRFDFNDWEQAFRVNTLAPIKLADAFVEHVASSELKKIVAVTSQLASIGENTSGGMYAYRSSKASLNAAFRSLAIDLSPRGITVALVHPGWVKTDMGGRAARMTAAESISRLREIIEKVRPRESGSFFNYDGAQIPW